MSNNISKNFYLWPALVTGALLFLCFLVSAALSSINPPQVVTLQFAFTLFQNVTGALLMMFGVFCILGGLAGSSPIVSFGRSALMVMLGLSCLTLSPLFAIAASLVLIGDSILPRIISRETITLADQAQDDGDETTA